MSRRSSRLASGGYYNSDEESDSSSVTTISYRENPVKVFKKKAGLRKAASRTSSRANSNASSASPETPDQYEALTPPPSSSATPVSMRTVPYPGSAPTPRPALTPACCPSSRAALHFRPSQTDSSGYSSSEGVSRKAPPAAGRPSTAELRRRVEGVVHSLTESASSTAAAAHSKILHLTAFAGSPSFRRQAKQAAVAVLLLLAFLLGLWFLLPFFASSISRLIPAKSAPQTEPPSQPAVPPLPPPPPPPQSDSAALDAAVVSAAVEAKVERLLAELQLKQEHLVSQVKTTLQRDLRAMKASLEAEESSRWVRLQQEVSGLGRQLEKLRSDGLSDAAALRLKIQTLEARSAQLSQDLSSVQQRPAPAPCPAPGPAPQRLTPELQQAMEKWFAERVKEQDAVRLADQGHCDDCGRPMADKMADFALETQGASVVSTRCSETYRIRSACVTLFGFPLWYPSESPRTVIQGFPVLLPGKCWAFHGVRGSLLISLSHPVRISHVTLDHLPRYNSPTGRIDSAPRDFQVYGLKNDTEEGALLGGFTYDEYGPSTQTFQLPNPSDVLFRLVELRVLTNWGHMEYTCVYRFRVHGKMASTS